MKKENSLILIVLAVSLVIITIGYVFLNPDMDSSTSQEGTPTQQPAASVPPQNGYTNPDYKDLTTEQVQIADIAIGKLLNSSEGITPPMISVISFEKKDFSDSSLDCPQPDMMYSQVITPGYQVVLEAQGKEYDYRLTDDKNVILCEQ